MRREVASTEVLVLKREIQVRVRENLILLDLASNIVLEIGLHLVLSVQSWRLSLLMHMRPIRILLIDLVLIGYLITGMLGIFVLSLALVMGIILMRKLWHTLNMLLKLLLTVRILEISLMERVRGGVVLRILVLAHVICRAHYLADLITNHLSMPASNPTPYSLRLNKMLFAMLKF